MNQDFFKTISEKTEKLREVNKRIEENKKRYKINFAITSNKDHYPYTLPILIPSLLSQTDGGNIVVVINCCDEDKSFIEDGIEYHMVTTSSFAYGCLCHLARFWDKYKDRADYWYNLNDTTQCFPHFVDMVYNFQPEVETYSNSEGASCDMGLLKSSYIQRIRSNLINKYYNNPQAFRWEDSLFLNKKENSWFRIQSLKDHGLGGKLTQITTTTPDTPTGHKDPYGTGTLRRTVFFTDIYLCKFRTPPGGKDQGFHGRIAP